MQFWHLIMQQASEAGSYLGLPLFVPRSKIHACHNIQEKISYRLAGWKARSLSQAGRTVLLQSVISAIPSYYMSVFMLPKRMNRGIDIRMKNFFWGFDGDSAQFHQNPGRVFVGLNLVVDWGCEKWKMQTVGKLGWEMASGKDCFWVRALTAKYCKGAHFLHVNTSQGESWICQSVMQTRDLVHAGFSWQIRDGKDQYML